MKYGLLADPNPEDFVEKLLLAKNKNLRHKLGMNAANMIKDKYSIDADIENLNSIFEKFN